MGVESTVIKDSKSRSGIIGLTGKGTSVVRWSLTRQLVGKYSAKMQERSRPKTSTSKEETYEQQRPSMLMRDEQHAQQMLSYLNDNFIDPFDIAEHPEGLVNISSGLNATYEVQKSLLASTDTGRSVFQSFVNERLSTEGTKSIWDPIPRSRLTTFTDMNKLTKVSLASRKVKVAISAEVVFRRALTLSDSRPDVNITSILSRPITAVPTMLFKVDGSRQKTTKADLTHWLEEKGKRIDAIPKDRKRSLYIIDGMADVQAVRENRFNTFKKLADNFLQNVMTLLDFSKDMEEVHVVYDRYDEEESVKAEERASRLGVRNNEHTKTYTIMPSANIPPWRKFLYSLENKESLCQFLSHYLTDNSVTYFLQPKFATKSLFVSGGFQKRETAKRVSARGVEDVECLQATHEEADTRMILHLVDADKRMAANGNRNARVIVKTPDTDVVCLAVHLFGRLSVVTELWIHTGSVDRNVNRVRLIPIHEVCKAVGPVICNILPAVHAITGCDTVSSLYYIGKQTVMKIVSRNNGEEFKDLTALGEENEEDAVNAARKLFIALYDPKKKHHVPALQNLNDLRVRLAKRNEQSLSRLPPCEDSFLQHVKRASWQAKVWMQADQPSPVISSPVGHGWQKENGIIVPVFFDGETASEILDDLVCSCNKRSKCDKNCTCTATGLPCIDLCSCRSEESCCNPRNKPMPEEFQCELGCKPSESGSV